MSKMLPSFVNKQTVTRGRGLGNPLSSMTDSSDDDLPDIRSIAVRKFNGEAWTDVATKETKSDKMSGLTHRRKLGPTTGNALLQPRSAESTSKQPTSTAENSRTSVRLRARKAHAAVQLGGDNDFEDGTLQSSAESDEDHDEDYQDNTADSLAGFSSSPMMEPRFRSDGARQQRSGADDDEAENTGSHPAKPRGDKTTHSRKTTRNDLVQSFGILQVSDLMRRLAHDEHYNTVDARPKTPPRAPSIAPYRGLVSPAKLPRVPATPNGPHSDQFWSREFVDDWNDRHSPKKLFTPVVKVNKRPQKKEAGKTTGQRVERKAFETGKRSLAEKFLVELDEIITGGRLAKLAASTGGIQLLWTKKLNTTAGRANWKRQKVRAENCDGGDEVVEERHFASIELAEKVINDEERLLNVVAHEFCHLATFMIDGVITNPHGKEFKVWARQCSSIFARRGIQVTTKHTYDIDFKYIWECTVCTKEFKRHSKSINPDRHRCGSCKSLLKQTKPVPRTSAQPSEYQKFMKKQMGLLKAENPGSPQKDIMKLVAQKWARVSREQPKDDTGHNAVSIDKVTERMGVLTMEDSD